jgi:hypothetical protein
MTPDAKPKKRWTKWRIFRWTLSLLILAFLGWVGFLLIVRQFTLEKNKKLLAEAISETERNDPRWRWEEIDADREPIPDERNSALILTEIRESLPKVVSYGDRLEAKRSDGELLLDQVEPNRLPDAEDRILLNRVLDQERTALNRALKLVNFPQGRHKFQLPNNPLEVRVNYANGTRYVFQLLSLEAEARTLLSDTDEALRCVRAILNSADSLRDENFLVSHLIRMRGRAVAVSRTNRMLALGAPQHELAELQAHFEREMKEEILRIVVRGVRAVNNDVFEKMEAGKLTLDDFSAVDRGTPNRKSQDTWDQFIQWRYDPYVYQNHAVYLRWCNQILAIDDLPWESRQIAFDQLPDIPLSFETALAYLLQSGFSGIPAAIHRDQARVRCVVVGIACERYRQKFGRWPATLESVPRDLLPELPTDPYDGQPLRYKHLDDGVVVYTLGPNLIDDGGKLRTRNMVMSQPHDIGFRLWHPEKRGLPAIEKRELLPIPALLDGPQEN